MQNLKHKFLITLIVAFSSLMTLGAAPALAAASCENSTPEALQKCLKRNPIVNDINEIVNFLSVGVGIVVVGVIILGGIQYAAAGDSPEAVSKAKQRIINGLIALVAFIFTFSFLQWLVPGGVFN